MLYEKQHPPVLGMGMCLGDFSLPLTPSRWEGGPLSGILLLFSSNEKSKSYNNLWFLLLIDKMPRSGSPPSGRGLGGGRNLACCLMSVDNENVIAYRHALGKFFG
jgi:hypothetical protein